MELKGGVVCADGSGQTGSMSAAVRCNKCKVHCQGQYDEFAIHQYTGLDTWSMDELIGFYAHCQGGR